MSQVFQDALDDGVVRRVRRPMYAVVQTGDSPDMFTGIQ